MNLLSLGNQMTHNNPSHGEIPFYLYRENLPRMFDNAGKCVVPVWAWRSTDPRSAGLQLLLFLSGFQVLESWMGNVLLILKYASWVFFSNNISSLVLFVDSSSIENMLVLWFQVLASVCAALVPGARCGLPPSAASPQQT